MEESCLSIELKVGSLVSKLENFSMDYLCDGCGAVNTSKFVSITELESSKRTVQEILNQIKDLKAQIHQKSSNFFGFLCDPEKTLSKSLFFGKVCAVLPDGSIYKGSVKGKASIISKTHTLSSFFDVGRRVSESVSLAFPKTNTRLIGSLPLSCVDMKKDMRKELEIRKMQIGQSVLMPILATSFDEGLFSGIARIHFKKGALIEGKFEKNRLIMDKLFPPKIKVKDAFYEVKGLEGNAITDNRGEALKIDYGKATLN